MDCAIRVENLSKQYRIGARSSASYQTLREALAEQAASVWRPIGCRLRGMSSQAMADEPGANGPDLFWALKDLSFEVEPGEIVGIIGRNGAGKSTLLKILSRITEPTSGRCKIRGRIGSLLEVGTGFHQELTGRENIYLNGSILGMSRREIERKFDEIVEFAEIERFLDTPVKRYSSGMYVRLAFAVAAHLEPEILVVDEVLAVGDARFQKKCLGKMGDIAKGGCTVLFVSHQMSAVQRLCRQCLWLEKGRIRSQGGKDEIIAQYLAEDGGRIQPRQWIDLTDLPRQGSREARFKRMRYRCPGSAIAEQPYPDGPFEIELCIESDARRQVDSLAVTFYDPYGTKLVNSDTLALGETLSLDRGTTNVLLRIEQLHLNLGQYILGLWLANTGRPFDYLLEAGRIEIVNRPGADISRQPLSDGLVTSRFSLSVSPEVHGKSIGL